MEARPLGSIDSPDSEGFAPLLEMRDIDKSFPGVQALKGVDLVVNSGECLALLGENGAGKSTLIKVLGGAQSSNAGEILLEGKQVRFDSPNAAFDSGIAIIYQELNLVPALTAAENVFLGAEPTSMGFVKRSEQSRRADELLRRVGAEINPGTPCSRLTVAQRQLVEIAKALAREARILVMDEPSAALTNKEVERLFELIDDLKARGIGIIYVSHRLEEIERVAERAVVLRDGERVGELFKEHLDRSRIIELMVGRKLDNEFPPSNRIPGKVKLRAKGLSRQPKVRDVSLEIRSGEIVALTGLVGSGRTETARLLFGADLMEDGTIEMEGRKLLLRCPSDAIEAGICLLTEDRKDQGLVLCRSVLENFGLPNLSSFSSAGWLDRQHEMQSLGGFVDKIRIRIAGQSQRVENLSGGNQQKVVLAKWLERDAEILIFDEPTRGIDVGAKYEIYQLMNELADRGKGVLMISSELPEVLGMSDRILVMRDGRIVGELKNEPGLTQEDVMNIAMGSEELKDDRP